jgi:hypothetical protein
MLTDDIPCMQYSWYPTQNRQTYIDQEIGAASGFEENGDWGKEEG